MSARFAALNTALHWTRVPLVNRPLAGWVHLVGESLFALRIDSDAIDYR